MRPIKLVHPSHARCVLTEDEAARLRHHGWLELPQPKAVSKGAAEQRLLRERRRAQGIRELLVWLPGEIFQALEDRKREGESMADVIIRLVNRSKLIE